MAQSPPNKLGILALAVAQAITRELTLTLRAS
jgi:hypothetical protein